MNLILNEERCLHPEDTASTLWIPFHLEKPAAVLRIYFSYGPKTVEDRDLCCLLLRDGARKYEVPSLADSREEQLEEFLPITNLVTMGLRGPDGFVGCAHRPAPDQLHCITEEKSSPGFLPCPVKAGEWRISLQIHAVFTPECRCRIRVEAEERGMAS